LCPIFGAHVLISPNHPIVEGIVYDSQSYLQDISKIHSFTELLRSGRDDTEILALKSLYLCLSERYDITYIQPQQSAISGSKTNYQKIKGPQHIFSLYPLALNGTGTCLDLALLMAACIEKVDLYPLVVFTGAEERRPTHAFVGCWIGSHGEHPLLDKERLCNELRSCNMIIIECTGCARGVTMDRLRKLSFEQAIELAHSTLAKEEWAVATDVKALRNSGLMTKTIYDFPLAYNTGMLELSDEEKRWFEEISIPDDLICTGREKDMKKAIERGQNLVIYGGPGVGKTYQICALTHFINGIFLRLKGFEIELENKIAAFLSDVINRAGRSYQQVYLVVEENYHGDKFDGNNIKAFLVSDILKTISKKCRTILAVRTNTYNDIHKDGSLPKDSCEISIDGLPKIPLDFYIEKNGLVEWVNKYNKIFDNIAFNPYALSLFSKLPTVNIPLDKIKNTEQQESLLDIVYFLYCQHSEENQEIIGAIVVLDEYFGVCPENVIRELWEDKWGYDVKRFTRTLKALEENGLIEYRENLILGPVVELKHDLLYQALRKRKDKIAHHYPVIDSLYSKLVNELFDILEEISRREQIISFDSYRNLFRKYYLYVSREKIGMGRKCRTILPALSDYLSIPHAKLDEAYQILQEIFHTLVDQTIRLGIQGNSLFEDLVLFTESITHYFDAKGEMDNKAAFWYELGWLADVVEIESKSCFLKTAEIVEKMYEKEINNGDREAALAFAWSSGYHYWRSGVFDKAAAVYEGLINLLEPNDIERFAEVARFIASCYYDQSQQLGNNINIIYSKVIEYYIKSADSIMENQPISFEALKRYKKATSLMTQVDPRQGFFAYPPEKVYFREITIRSRTSTLAGFYRYL